jgi:hypothetical protein
MKSQLEAVWLLGEGFSISIIMAVQNLVLPHHILISMSGTPPFWRFWTLDFSSPFEKMAS